MSAFTVGEHDLYTVVSTKVHDVPMQVGAVVAEANLKLAQDIRGERREQVACEVEYGEYIEIPDARPVNLMSVMQGIVNPLGALLDELELPDAKPGRRPTPTNRSRRSTSRFRSNRCGRYSLRWSTGETVPNAPRRSRHRQRLLLPDRRQGTSLVIDRRGGATAVGRVRQAVILASPRELLPGLLMLPPCAPRHTPGFTRCPLLRTGRASPAALAAPCGSGGGQLGRRSDCDKLPCSTAKTRWASSDRRPRAPE